MPETIVVSEKFTVTYKVDAKHTGQRRRAGFIGRVLELATPRRRVQADVDFRIDFDRVASVPGLRREAA